MIATATVIVADLSGFIPELKEALRRMTGRRFKLKPLDCSFCMTFWLCLAYNLCQGTLTLWSVTYALILSVMTPVIGEAIMTVRDLALRLIRLINP